MPKSPTIGGGITGLTAAVLLKRSGKTVVLIEARRIAEGVTGHTTAKVTSQHHITYNALINGHGVEKARLYAQANEAAIDRVESFVDEKNIDCDFRRLPAYVYTESAETVPQLRSEVEAARRVGLPASFTRDAPLPFSVEGAIRFENQAQFHVREYLLPLAEEIPGDGSHLFEGTRALDVKEGIQCRVETDRGRVIARDVVVATHVPFLFKGQFWGKAVPQREYGTAARRIGETVATQGISISAGSPTRSIRTASRNGETVLIVVGVVAYAVLVLLLRISGKRTLSKMNAFDLVVTVALGSTLATVLLSSTVALAEGLLALALLVFLQFAITWSSVRSSTVQRLVKDEPRLLFYEGRFLKDAIRSERVTEEEIESAMRQQGFATLDGVGAAVLETEGSITIIPDTDPGSTSTLTNVAGRPDKGAQDAPQ